MGRAVASTARRGLSYRRGRAGWTAVLALAALLPGALGPVVPNAAAAVAGPHLAGAGPKAVGSSTSTGTVWLCRPGMAADPCTESLRTSVVQASGAIAVQAPAVATSSRFDCFYVYPTVSTETTTNSDLRPQPAETATAVAQASRFSTVCRVWAPMYRQITLPALQLMLRSPNTVTPAELVALNTAYDSLRAGFEDYLAHDNDGRPIIFIGHSQGASMVINLLRQVVDGNAGLRSRLVLAIILGGNVVVPNGALVGGSFSHIPVCTSAGQAGCVIAYSSFPVPPPAASLFGRPGQGVSLMAGQTAKTGVHVVCTNPAALAGGAALLDPFFPTEGLLSTPWVEFPNLYRATCESVGGATWLQVTKISGASDRRPTVTESAGPDWGYHDYDVNLALGNLLSDTTAAEISWSKGAR